MWSIYLKFPHLNPVCTCPLIIIIIIIIVTTTINFTKTITIIIAENLKLLRHWNYKSLSCTNSNFVSLPWLELLPHNQYRIHNVQVCLWSVSLPNFPHYAHKVLQSSTSNRMPKKIVLPPLVRFQILLKKKFYMAYFFFIYDHTSFQDTRKVALTSLPPHKFALPPCSYYILSETKKSEFRPKVNKKFCVSLSNGDLK